MSSTTISRHFVRAWFIGCVLALLPTSLAAQDVVYAFPARPPGWEAQLWPAQPVVAPANFAKKQREQWGDERLDMGALRSSRASWEVLVGAGWVLYDPIDHIGIVRMYYRYGLHSYRGQVHQEPEGRYQQLSLSFPTEFPSFPWIYERPPTRPDERPLEDVGMIRALNDSVTREWRRRFLAEEGGGGSTSESGLISARPMALAVTAEIDSAGSVAIPLEIFDTSRTWAVEAQRTGLPASVAFKVTARRGTGPTTNEVSLSWPAGLPVGIYERARVQLSVGGGPQNKLWIPLVFTVRETVPAPEPEPLPEPEPIPDPEPGPSECPPPPVCRCEAQVSRAIIEPVGVTVLCIPGQEPPQ